MGKWSWKPGMTLPVWFYHRNAKLCSKTNPRQLFITITIALQFEFIREMVIRHVLEVT